MKIVRDSKSEFWDKYIREKSFSNLYLLSGWKEVIEKSFNRETFYLSAIDNDRICGVLPLAMFSSRIFGRFMVSVPFFNYGGICADSDNIANALFNEAVRIAKERDCGFIELRQTKKMNIPGQVKEKKVTFFLDLTVGEEALWKIIGPKVRNQVRKAEKSGCSTENGCKELLKDFYQVFARNMRDLGTPVYSYKFFQNICDQFPNFSRIFVVRWRDKPVASAFTLGYNGRIEIPWASSLRKYNKYCPNMLLYWKIIEYGFKHSYKIFDFGRCTKGGPTYHFKKQWGGEEVPITWHYWLPEGEKLPEVNPDNPKYSFAVKTWQKLPVWLTKIIGPWIIRNIP